MESGKHRRIWHIVKICIVVAVLTIPLIIVIWQASNYSDNSVVVTLHNTETKPISSVVLKHTHGVIRVKELLPGRYKEVRFDSPGESSYTLRVTFQNGKVVTGGFGYVESCYRVTETITTKGIKSDFVLPGSNEITALSYWIYGIIAIILWQIVKYFAVLRKRRLLLRHQ